MNVMETLINSMNRNEISITLALLHHRMCELNKDKKCAECPWCASTLCLPLYHHLEMEKERMSNEAKERNGT